MKQLLVIILLLTAAFSSSAVTDKEMDQAKAVAAKLYLRWSNNASGYLDEIEVKSMADLKAKLKDKEKENLKAFNAVKVPSDYASWTKEQFVKYWSETFFASPGLNPDGVRAKGRVKNKLSAMTVSAPQQNTETAPEPAAPASTPAPETAVADTAMPDAAQVQEEILNDQNAIAKDAAEAQEPLTSPQQSHTWVYILVLSILAALVIWLVVYAANLMKRQPGANEDEDFSPEAAMLRDQARKAIAKKDDEISSLHKRLQEEEKRNSSLAMDIEKLKLENKRLRENVELLREENSHAAEQRQAPRVKETPKAAPKEPSKPAPAPNSAVLKVIYLGRANNNGIFVRADRRLNPGASIFRLDTNDGLVGTFHVVDEPEVVELAVSNPASYLANGCTGEDLSDTVGVTRIITESPGTAIFENGCWRLLRKTRIRYE